MIRSTVLSRHDVVKGKSLWVHQLRQTTVFTAVGGPGTDRLIQMSPRHYLRAEEGFFALWIARALINAINSPASMYALYSRRSAEVSSPSVHLSANTCTRSLSASANIK